MSRVIAVANQKGGVGKTTTAANLAAGLANNKTAKFEALRVTSGDKVSVGALVVSETLLPYFK